MVKGSPRHSQSNGGVERVNLTVQKTRYFSTLSHELLFAVSTYCEVERLVPIDVFERRANIHRLLLSVSKNLRRNRSSDIVLCCCFSFHLHQILAYTSSNRFRRNLL